MDAEVELLAAFIQKPESRRLMAQLTENDFSQAFHADIFAAMSRIQASSLKFTIRTVHDVMNGTHEVDYSHLQNALMTFSSDYEGAFQCIKTANIKRKVFHVAEQMKNSLNGGSEMALSAISKAISDLTKLNTTTGAWRAITAIEATKDYVTDLQDRINRDGLLGISSGLSKVDHFIGGWSAPDLITVGGRSSMGKSAYAVFTAIEAAKRGKKVMYFSTEMGVKQLISRMVAQMSPVAMNVAQWRGMEKVDSTESMNRLLSGVDRVSNLPIWIDDQAVVPVEEIVCRATAQHYEIGCDLIIVDHMHDIPHSHENSVRAYGHIAKTLKNLAKTLNVPVMMLAQLNRAAAGAVVELPKMTNLEGAGGIEQASDSVLLLHHPFYYDNTKTPYEYKMVVAKNRQGERGMVLNIGYIGKYQQFFNDPEEAARFECAGDF